MTHERRPVAGVQMRRPERDYQNENGDGQCDEGFHDGRGDFHLEHEHGDDDADDYHRR